MSSSGPKEMAGVVAERKDRSDAAVADQPATRGQTPVSASALVGRAARAAGNAVRTCTVALSSPKHTVSVCGRCLTSPPLQAAAA